MRQNNNSNLTLSFLFIIAAIFLGGLRNQACADDDNTTTLTTPRDPKLTFSGNGYKEGEAMTAVAGQNSFSRPSLSVEDQNGDLIRSRFKLTWEVVPTGDKTATLENNSDGKRVSVDPNTGSSVQVVYGVVAIGEKVGSFTVRVTATPITKWASTYNTTQAEYEVTVNAPTINSTLFLGANVLATADGGTTKATETTLTVNTYQGKGSNGTPNQYLSTQTYLSMTRALPTMTISHELNGITINDSAKYTITYTFGTGEKFKVDGKGNFKAITTDGDNANGATGTLTITATPKDSYTTGDDDDDPITVDKDIYKTITYTVAVKAEYLDGSKQLKTYIKFVRNGKQQNEVTHYRDYRKDGATVYNYYAPEELPEVKIEDEYGNDVTSAYVIVYGSKDADDNFTSNEVSGQDVIHKYSKDPLDAYGSWAYYKNEKNEATIYVSRRSETNTNRALYRTTAGTNGKSACYQPDDYIVTANAFIKQPNNTNLQTLGWWHDDDGTVPDYSKLYAAQPTTKTKEDDDKEMSIYNEDGSENTSRKIKGQLYDTDNNNIYTGLKSNQLVIHLLKRAATIQFTPDPSTVTLANGVEMTPTNRFQVVGTLHDTTIDGLGIDSLKYDGSNANSFSYCIFVPDEDVYDGNEPTDGKVTIELKSGWSTVEDGTQIVDVIGADGKPTGEKVEKTGKRYFSKLMWHNDDLRMVFHGKGYGKLYYNLIPWTPQNWDISQSLATVFTVAEAEPTTLVVDPKTIYTAVNTWSVPPSIKVVDQFGADVTEHFDFNLDDGVQWDSNLKNYWKNESNHSEGTNPDFGSYKPYQKGSVSIKVTATKKSDDSSQYSDPDNTETYQVVTKDSYGEDTKSTYEIIYEDLYSETSGKAINTSSKYIGLNDSESSSKMGKLHFINAGSMYPGLQSYREVPGINITFGNAEESDNYTVSSTTVTNSALRDNDNDNGSANGEVKRCLIEIPGVTFKSDNSGVVEPDYGYIRIDALTYGWLTVDGNFTRPSDGERRYTLMDLTTHTSQNISLKSSDASDKIGEQKFPTMLEPGKSYAFYCADGMQIHGINFDPEFINDNRDHAGIHSAISFQNGFTGNLPTLSTLTTPTLSYYVRDNATETATAVTDITDGKGYHASVTTSTGRVTSLQLTNGGNLTVANGAEVDYRVGVVGRILGKDRTGDGLGQVEKRPHYNLFIGDMPTYIVQDGEAFDQGNRLSTTNIPTRIWMTIGGWEHGMSVQNEYPYYKNNDFKNALADSWNEAKMDSTGRDNMTVDNFNYHAQGTQNPVDEKVKSYTSGEKNTFCVPVRGTYLKFEPEESGQLFVYVLQNGLTDLAAANTSKIDKAVANYNKNKDGDYRLRRRAMYIIDETGQKVDLDEGNGDWQSLGMDKYLPGSSSSTRNNQYYENYKYPNMNYYTEGITRVAWKFNNDEKELTFTKPDGTGDYTNYQDDQNTIKNWWNRTGDDLHGYTGNILGGPLEVLELQDKSYAIPTKGYVRYSFKVKAGKVYYMFTTGSKLGFCGFGFLPEGYSGGSSNSNTWIDNATGAKSEDERSFAESVLDKLPEPTATEYSPETDKENEYGMSSTEGDYITLDASLRSDATGSYTNLSTSLKTRSFVNVKLKRNLYNKKWNGICLPFTVSEHQVKKVFGENAEVITFDSIRGAKGVENTVHFTRHVAQHMEAGRPYFIYPSLDNVAAGTAIDNGEIIFKHVSFENADTMDVDCKNTDFINNNSTIPEAVLTDNPDAVAKTDSIYLYNVKGIYDCTRIPKWSYYMNAREAGTNGVLKRLAPKSETSKNPLLTGYNAYIYIVSSDANGKNKVDPSKSNAPAPFWIRGSWVSKEDNTSGIDEIYGSLTEDINVNQTAFVDGVYTIDGMRVRTENSLKGLAPGVYIMGGKKYTVK